MAATNFLITLVSSQDVGDLSFSNWGKGRVTKEVAKLVEALGAGAFTGSIDVQNAPAYATGTWTAATATGVVGVAIGGFAVTVTAAGGDTATATALAAAINADASAKTVVTAAAAAAVVTLTALVPGTIGNGLTLATSGAGTGQSVGGARLAGGTGAPGNSFTC